ncbi:CocE/NonD family hydrolase, partial [Planctomycetaceae bacterium]|nr:CocE/NonD family hydrolase [Planctomycetaceae bacterium]
ASLRGKSTREAAARIAKHGFVVALINYRGTHLSEGKWVGYRAMQWGERQDGYDSCEWLAKQSWSTGKVGTFGSSQGGYAQNYLAVTQPPSLVCQYMTDTGLSLFHEGYRIGGTTRPERFKSMESICRNPEDQREVLREWFEHPHYDDYWKAEDCTLHFDKMNVPCVTIGSWYDFMNQGSIASFQGRNTKGGPHSRGHQHLVIGPWLHGRLNKGNRVGGLEYPENAAWPVEEHMVGWFNHYLKGEQNAAEEEPAVRYYVMGAVGEKDAPGNNWRLAKTFPPSTDSTSYNQIDFNLGYTHPTNKPHFDRKIKAMICPSNPISDQVFLTGGHIVHYSAMTGSATTSFFPTPFNLETIPWAAGSTTYQDKRGMFYHNSRTSMASVTDGTSNTIAVSETFGYQPTSAATPLEVMTGQGQTFSILTTTGFAINQFSLMSRWFTPSSFHTGGTQVLLAEKSL